MIIVKIMGGLGNQLFQYALCYALEKKGADVKVDTSFYDSFNEENTERESIKELLGIEFEEASRDSVDICKKKNEEVIWKYILSRIPLLRQYIPYYVEESEEYKRCILTRKNGYLFGYWQTAKYFNDIRSVILDKFIKIEKPKSVEYTELERTIIESNHAVSIHIRGGDYYNKYNIEKMGGICNLHYYSKAIEIIKSTWNDATFFVFTDDDKLAKNVLPSDEKYNFVRSTLWNDYYDLLLMSECDGNIIANSSFSWWAAWLNKNNSKVVVSPRQWNKTKRVRDIYCKDWILI